MTMRHCTKSPRRRNKHQLFFTVHPNESINHNSENKWIFPFWLYGHLQMIIKHWTKFQVPPTDYIGKTRGPWATSLTWVTLAHMKIFFKFKYMYTFHFLLPHLTVWRTDFDKLAYVLCQKAFMQISDDFNKSTPTQTIHT